MSKRLPLLLLLALTLAGCDNKKEQGQDPGMDPGLETAAEVCLNVKGKRIFTYAEGTTQLGFNRALRQFRAGNDDMTTYFIVTCSELPVKEGQEIRADLSWRVSGNSAKTTGKAFTVMKIEDTGLVRLWCAADKTGAVVRILD